MLSWTAQFLLPLQIFTLWQACVGVCHAFPLSPDVLAMVHAIAEEAGELSADDMSAACFGSYDDQGAGQSDSVLGCFHLCLACIKMALASVHSLWVSHLPLPPLKFPLLWPIGGCRCMLQGMKRQERDSMLKFFCSVHVSERDYPSSST